MQRSCQCDIRTKIWYHIDTCIITRIYQAVKSKELPSSKYMANVMLMPREFRHTYCWYLINVACQISTTEGRHDIKRTRWHFLEVYMHIWILVGFTHFRCHSMRKVKILQSWIFFANFLPPNLSCKFHAANPPTHSKQELTILSKRKKELSKWNIWWKWGWRLLFHYRHGRTVQQSLKNCNSRFD